MHSTEDLKDLIEEAFDKRGQIDQSNAPPDVVNAVETVLGLLDTGEQRVAEPEGNGSWKTNEWLKKAILLSFKLRDNHGMDGGWTRYYDKVDLKFADKSDEDLRLMGCRVVPPAVARKGCYIAAGVVMMPSYVNIGAYIDEGTMVDTWATVGSCAQIGRNVHISGGVGIGGVLEPLQAKPTIIEDDCFIGARSEIVEGVVVGRGSVISMGVFLGQSTRIYDRQTGEIFHGAVKPGSVVVPGSLPGKDGKHSLNCAVVVKQVDEQTRAKTSINELLRPE